MKITVLGTGRMGSAIATAFAQRTSHTIFVRGSHAKSRSAKGVATQIKAEVASDALLLACDVVILAVPAEALQDAARSLQGYTGLILSAVVPGSDGNAPSGQARSAAEQVAALVPGATVATAFNSISSILLRDPGADGKPSVFVCCDRPSGKARTMDLVREVGFEPIDSGSLGAARMAEDMGLLVVHLAYAAGYGDRVSLKVAVF